MKITLRPAAPERIGEVLDALARVPLTMGNAERRKVADRVRQGLARNFTSESAGGVPWPKLAALTVEERRELGFPGEHPILQRTRQLKLSWTDAGHPLHSENWGAFAGSVVLVIRSEDPRVPDLSGENPIIPARFMHMLSDEDIRGLEETLVFVMEQGTARIE